MRSFKKKSSGRRLRKKAVRGQTKAPLAKTPPVLFATDPQDQFLMDALQPFWAWRVGSR